MLRFWKLLSVGGHGADSAGSGMVPTPAMSSPLWGQRDTHSGRSTGAGGCRVGIFVFSCHTAETGGGWRGQLSRTLPPRQGPGPGWDHSAKATPDSSKWAHRCQLAGGGVGGASGVGAQPGTTVGGLVGG